MRDKRQKKEIENEIRKFLKKKDESLMDFLIVVIELFRMIIFKKNVLAEEFINMFEMDTEDKKDFVCEIMVIVEFIINTFKNSDE